MGNHVHKLMPYHKLNTYQKAQHAKRKKTPAKPRAHTLQRVQTPSAGKKCAASRTHTNVRARAPANIYLWPLFILARAINWRASQDQRWTKRQAYLIYSGPKLLI